MAPPASLGRDLNRRLLTSGVLFGIGVAAFVDETVFHQLLHWHHFYDLATTRVGMVSDGLFHAFGWFAAVAGLFLLADVRRRGGVGLARWIPAVAIGTGGFQLFDGTINHKLLRVHQLRYEEVPITLPDGRGPYTPIHNLIVYDTVWLVVAVLLLAGGTLLWRRGTRHAQAGARA